jgi:hypothetical protein
MELLLNLAWAMLAAIMVGLWLRTAVRSEADRVMQLTALAVLLLILFPVISVSDDLLALQNPAEVDSCLRRDHTPSSHSIFPPVAEQPQPAIAERTFGFLSHAAPGHPSAMPANHPGIAAIENRPPPAA